jgi:hypothetical protein
VALDKPTPARGELPRRRRELEEGIAMGLFSRHKDEDAPPDPSTLIDPPLVTPVAAPLAAPVAASAPGAGPVVVSATDGPLQATKDAFAAIHDSGATTVDVAIVNCGLVEDEELLELVELEIRELASSAGLSVGQLTRS